jgi:hypothetical protein
MDLIPTTGAAIYVRYGEQLKTKICLKDDTEIQGEGTKILEDYAILDDRRKMHDDVVSVEVECNHPFLKMGVEFLDLPGTNDREEQNKLVKDKLLTADIIIHVLLQHDTFNLWLEKEFQPTVTKYIDAIAQWVNKGCEFFGKEYDRKLVITFPELSTIERNDNKNNNSSDRKTSDNATSVAIPVGLGWLLGGAVGAVVLGGASYVLNQLSTSETSTESTNNNDSLASEVEQIYLDAAQNYLTDFSQQAFVTLYAYETATENLVSFTSNTTQSTTTQAEYQLQLLDNSLKTLQEELEEIN